MAIQMRRGLKKDFDPSKMLPGEWAVSTDSDTQNQIIWMCFAPGIVKRMGTYEDFKSQIHEASAEIWEPYEETLNEIKSYMEGLANTAKGYRDTAAAKAGEAAASAGDARNYVTDAESAAVAAANSAEDALMHSIDSQNAAAQSNEYAEDSKTYADESKSYAVGTEGEFRPGDDTDCAKHYYEQSKRILDSFADIGAVAGVKGNAESVFRSGLVNITPDNVGVYDKAYIDSLARVMAKILSATGWYRIAKIAYESNLVVTQGGTPYSCILTIKRTYSNTNAEYHSVRLVSRYQHSDIVELSSSALNDASKIITAVRHTVDQNAKTTYLEVYYNSEVGNAVYFTLSDNYSAFSFSFIEPEKTSDALASGVTKYSQCDLSTYNPKGDAGRSDYLKEPDGSGLFKSTATVNLGADAIDASAIGYVNGLTANTMFGHADGALYKQVYSSSWVHEIYGDYRTGQIAIRGKSNGTWQPWRKVLDSANFSNYVLPKNGNAASATKATQDGNGDNIANTYVKKSIYINDFNSTEACNPGFFIARSAKNAPENKQDNFSLLVMRTENGSGGPYAHQIAMQSATFNIYVRYVHDRMTFSEWKKVSLMSI